MPPSFTGHKTETFTVANSLATNVAALLATSGVDITNAKGVTGVLAAESTRTLTGGALRAYAYMPTVANNDGSVNTYSWVPYNAADITPVTSTVADRYFPFGDSAALTGVGRIVWLPDAITVSAGTTVSITYTTRRNRG
jgi:hypothetical protein